MCRFIFFSFGSRSTLKQRSSALPSFLVPRPAGQVSLLRLVGTWSNLAFHIFHSDASHLFSIVSLVSFPPPLLPMCHCLRITAVESALLAASSRRWLIRPGSSARIIAKAALLLVLFFFLSYFLTIFLSFFLTFFKALCLDLSQNKNVGDFDFMPVF